MLYNNQFTDLAECYLIILYDIIKLIFNLIINLKT